MNIMCVMRIEQFLQAGVLRLLASSCLMAFSLSCSMTKSSSSSCAIAWVWCFGGLVGLKYKKHGWMIGVVGHDFT
jgi:hypothetical protein